MGQEGENSRHHLARGGDRLRRGQRHDPALPLRIAAAVGSTRERFPARGSRQEQRRPHHDRSRGGHQSDPIGAVARFGAPSHQEGKAHRPARIRSFRRRQVGAENHPRHVRHRPRSEHAHAGRADARILLRPAQRLRGGKIPRNRHRFRFSQSRACRPRRQRDRGGLPANAAGRQTGSNPRRRQLACRRDCQPAYEGGRRRSQGG